MRAGMDCGASCVKVAWEEDGNLRLFSTADRPFEEIRSLMDRAGIGSIRITGAGPRPELPGASIIPVDTGNPVGDEMRMQVAGARELFRGLPEEFLLVSIGTGTSFNFVTPRAVDGVKRLMFGSSLGGGFLAGLARLQGILPSSIDDYASRGKAQEIIFSDLFPEHGGGAMGAMVVASCARLHNESSTADICASLIRTVAVSIVRDIIHFGRMEARSFNDVVFVGTPASTMTRLSEDLTSFCAMSGIKPRFSTGGAYAAAIGALLEP
jgi:hypothetical protein